MSLSAASNARTGPSALHAPGHVLRLPPHHLGQQPLRTYSISLVALLARFSIAAVFWNSGQTKITGFALNIATGEFAIGWPRLSDSALTLFQYEYNLPFIAPTVAAPMAAMAERLFPLLLLIGLGTRLSALSLLIMTLVIQVFVYPGAYATHGTWAALLLLLMSRGAGAISVDHWIARRHQLPA